MSVWAEIWPRPGDGSFVRQIALPDFENLTFQSAINSIGYGRLSVDSDYPRLDEILDPSNNISRLVRVFDDGENVYSFFAKTMSQEQGAGQRVDISGPGIESVMDWAILFPFDTPSGSPATWKSEQPDWIFGGKNALLSNESFEDVTGTESWEDGDLAGWSPTISAGDNRAPDSVVVVDDAANAHDGTHAVKIDAGTRHSGIKKSFTVVPGGNYVITAWLKSPTVGDRWTMAVELGSGGVQNSVGYIYNGYALTELDNVAPNSKHNGLPGGSTDGTWQSWVCNVNAGTDQTSMEVILQFDHHDGSNGPVAYVDDFSIVGPGIGLIPWVPFNLSTWTQDNTHVDSGSYAVKWQTSGTGQNKDGFYQEIDTEIGKTYTYKIRLYHEAGVDKNYNIIMQPPNFGPWIANTSVAVPTATQTDLVVTGVATTEKTWITVTFDETGVSPVTWADTASASEGLAEATVGEIMTTFMDDAQTRGALTFLQHSSFSAATDSNGNTWGTTVSCSLSRGQSYAQILDLFSSWGYEWEVVWNTSTYELNLYDRFSMGTDISSGPLKIQPGRMLKKAIVQRGEPKSTFALGEGDEYVFSTDNIDTIESGLLAAYGRRESYIGTNDIRENATIDLALQRSLQFSANTKYTSKLTLDGNEIRYGVDLHIGDTINVEVQPLLPNAARRLYSVHVVVDAEGNVDLICDFGKRVLLEQIGGTTSSPTSVAVNYLLREFKKLQRPIPSLNAIEGSVNAKAYPWVLVAASDAPQDVRDAADYICDGVNDHEEIQSAIEQVTSSSAAAGTVELSEGYFSVSIPSGGYAIDLPNYVRLIGQGISATFVDDNSTSDPGSSAALIRMGNYSTVADMQPAVYWDNVPTILIGTSIYWATIRNCWIHAADGPAISAPLGSQYLTIARNHIDAGVNTETWGAIHLAGSNQYGWIVDNNINGGGSGIFSNGGSLFGYKIARNTINQTGWSGVKLIASGTSAPAWVRITDNLIYSAAQSASTVGTNGGIALIGATGAVFQDTSPGNQIGSIITGNTIENVPAGHGIYLDESPGVKVSDNSIEQATGHGIAVNNSDGCQVVDNLIAWPGQWFPAQSYDGINVATTDYGLIVGNLIRPEQPSSDFLRYGIRIETGCTANAIYGNDVRLLGASAVAYSDAGTNTLWGPAADEWNVALPSARNDQDVLTWDTTSSKWILTTPLTASDVPSLVDQYQNFSSTGTLTVKTGTHRMVFANAATLQGVIASVGTAPTGSSVIVDVLLNGTSVYPTSSKPTIADGSNQSTEAVPDTTSVSAGDYLTVDITQVGSTTPGADLVVSIRWRDIA